MGMYVGKEQSKYPTPTASEEALRDPDVELSDLSPKGGVTLGVGAAKAVGKAASKRFRVIFSGASSSYGEKGRVVGEHSTRKRAKRAADKADSEYGAYVHRVEEVEGK